MEEECCECFKKIANMFYWYNITLDKEEKKCMPHLLIDEGQFRVNYCPICGSSVRSVMLNRVNNK